MTVLQTIQGSTAPQETFTVTRPDGSIVNLTGAAVDLKIENPITNAITNSSSSTCAIVNATNGICAYNWTPGGTDTPVVGIYNAWMVVTYAGGTTENYSMLIEVAPSPTSSAAIAAY